MQKKFLLGFVSFILFVFIIGFISGFFGCPRVEDKSCCGAKNADDDDTSGRLLEQQALELVLGQKIRHYLRYFANQTSEANDTCSQALYIKKEWNSLGLETVQLKRYEVLLPHPKRPSVLTLTDNKGAAVYSSILKSLTGTDDALKTTVPFSAQSASGVATGKLIYINYGRDSDFKYLDASNVSCRGKIVIARYGRIFEENKVVNAQKWNAKGLLLYVDPADYASQDTIRNLSEIIEWYPSNEVHSGGLWVNRGDPLTPGYPATTGIYRESLDDIPLPKIPVQPISRRDAETLLRMLNHTHAPQDWQGNLGFSYGIQMDPSDQRNITINVSLSFVKRAVCDVVGTIKGKLEPDRYVLLGSRRPSGGTAVVMEIARILLSMRKKGWFPRRSIKLCSWGAGEYGNIGTVEWIEEYERILETRAVAYINADSAVQGQFVVTSNPLLEKTVLKAMKKVASPRNKSRTLHDDWKDANPDETGKQHGLLSINRGSGCSPFAYRIGVPCADLSYQLNNDSLNYPLQHPLYDIPDTFEYYRTLAQVWLQMTFDIAGSVLVPFDVTRYADALCTFGTDLSTSYSGILKENNISLDILLNVSQNFLTTAKMFKKCLRKQEKKDVLQVRMINDRLLQIDRAFINKEGVPGMPFLRHVVLAPSYFEAKPDSKFPGITDTIHIATNSGKKKDWMRVKKQISVVIHAVRSAISVLRPQEV